MDQTQEGSHSRAVRYCSNLPLKSVRDSQGDAVSPKNREIFNGFKSRLKESLLLEQTRSLHKDDAIAKFIKKTNELNVYAMGGDSIDTGGEQEESQPETPHINQGDYPASPQVKQRKLTERQKIK